MMRLDATVRDESRRVLEVRVDATSCEVAAARIALWAQRGESRYVCACNVHMAMEAHDDLSFRDIVNRADLVSPDGVPLVWALRLMGVANAERVYGPDLMLAVCAVAEQVDISVGLYGATQALLHRLIEGLQQRFPKLDIAYAHAPGFGPVRESVTDIEHIRAAGVRILFVALGCPKQERWMALHRGRIPAVMLGVGAAFDFISGTKPQAPRILQTMGLEWAFRLASEPRRLWRRYAVHNPRFAALLLRQLLRREGGFSPPT